MEMRPPPTQRAKTTPLMILRWLKMCGGTVASFFSQACTLMKAIIRIPESTNSTIMRPLFQAYAVPPHCKARRKQITDGKKRTLPSGSRRRICLFQPQG